MPGKVKYIPILDRWVPEYLSLRTEEEHDKFINRPESTLFVLHKAFEYVEGMPLSDLPKYINHPSENIKDIVTKRLQGKYDFFFKEYYK